jgi:hypothetical protein
MTIKYTEKVSDLGWAYIERDNADGTISVIPIDEANCDYQAYLNPDKVEHLTEIVPPVVE